MRHIIIMRQWFASLKIRQRCIIEYYFFANEDLKWECNCSRSARFGWLFLQSVTTKSNWIGFVLADSPISTCWVSECGAKWSAGGVAYIAAVILTKTRTCLATMTWCRSLSTPNVNSSPHPNPHRTLFHKLYTARQKNKRFLITLRWKQDAFWKKFGKLIWRGSLDRLTITVVALHMND